ncbi:LysR family transcriptional regulator [Thalassomonas viridans]|uniref:LysR family transcriptional regulator n=1 Tax=Thalassomonas viridans TaxID=137584 RepID=A0AAE9Z7A8_9GAMM|nr:LysR family transcriptional regulator [Thalassomonas viridans]WDE07552.1 LysR family transcriptional regulator [Thalassomonas viridans]
MDLNLFKVFEAIYAQGNITLAARALNLSQPAVSHALAKLRTQFDDPLFTRQGNRMRPTAVAKNVIGEVRQALHQLQVSLQQSRHFDPLNSQKHCNLALHASLEALYLPPLMSALNRQAPNINLTSIRARRREMEHKLACGDVDLAIDVLLPVGESIRHRRMQNDRLVVVAGEGHSVLAQARQLDLATYLKHSHILVSSRVSGPGIEDFELGRLGLQRRVGLRCQQLFSACLVAASSEMLLTLPETAAKVFAAMLAIKVYPLPVDLPGIDVHLYWHLNADKDPANLWLREQLLTAASGTGIRAEPDTAKKTAG